MGRRRSLYRVQLDEEGGKLSFDEAFWNEEPTQESISKLEKNVEALISELKTALYWIAAQRAIRH